MNLDSVPLSLLEFKYGRNKNHISVSLSLIKYGKNRSHLCLTFKNQRHDLVDINEL